MSAWHGDADLKARIVERMKQHREADDFIQGLYQKIDPASALGYRGCAIGCLLEKQEWRDLGFGETDSEPLRGWHEEVEHQFGILADVAEIIDDCFEASDPPDHAKFAVNAIEAIPVGADLSRVADAYVEGRGQDENPRLLLNILRAAPILAATDA